MKFLETPIPNAFTINLLGNMPFPLSIKCQQSDEILLGYLFALRVEDIADLLGAYGMPNSLVFEVSHVWLIDSEGDRQRPLPINKIAEVQQVPYSEIDKNTILIASQDVLHLLKDFYHFDFHLLDSPSIMSEEQIIEVYDVQLKHEYPLLKKVAGSSIYLDSHDDCYLYLETNNHVFMREVLSRLLQIFAGTVLYNTIQKTIAISPVPTDIFQDLGWPTLTLNSLQNAAFFAEDFIQLNLELEEFKFRQAHNQPEEITLRRILRYYLAEQKWELI